MLFLEKNIDDLQNLSPERLKIKSLLSKFAYANFVLYLGSLRAVALKNPAKGLCPLTPPLLKKWTKLLIVIATGCVSIITHY